MTASMDDIEAWLASGWAIFPCHSIRDDRCSCGDANCGSPGKHPRTWTGVHAATHDPDTAHAWSTQYPDANWAVATGSKSDLVVIDLDVKEGKDGYQSFSRFLEDVGLPDPQTFAVRTGSGGRHLYFRTMGEPFRNRVNWMPGVDVRGDGGYVLLPSSNHISGGTYEVESNGSVAMLPRQIASAIQQPSTSTWEAPSALLAGVGEGRRDDHLFRLACSFRRRLGDDREAVTLLVLEAARRCTPPFPEREALVKVQSAFEQDHSDLIDLSKVPFAADVDDLYVDVAQALASGLKVIEPSAGSLRTDGLFLLYAGKVNVLMGDPESGKTLIALAMAVDTLRRGESAAILDLDHNGTVETLTRLIAFGADPEVLGDRSLFRLALPETQGEYMAVLGDLIDWAPGMVVVDSIGELGALFGANLNRDEDFAPLNRRAIQPFATAGSAVLCVDHMAKNEQSRSFGAGGTIRKKAAVNGASYEVRLQGSGFTRSRGGRSQLVLKKDRPGGIRDRSPNDRDPVVAEFVLAPPGLSVTHSTWEFSSGIDLESARRERANAKQATAADAVLEALAQGERNKGDLHGVLHDVGVTNTGDKDEVLRRMLADGLITFRERGRSHLYSRVER